jgi:hypothetical protein
MELTAQLAGFFTAHAVWCVSDGETLIPLLAFEKRDGSRQIRRLNAPDREAAVAEGREWLKRNPEAAARAVLIYDGFVHEGESQREALVTEAQKFSGEGRSLIVATPYRSAQSPEGFAVYRPQFLSQGSDEDIGNLADAFFRGLARHKQGAEVWNAHFDENG